MAGNQLGKELRWDQLVLTPTGWKQICDIRVGDMVIAGDGTPTRVNGFYPQGIKPMVEITFCEGQKVVAGYEHLWMVLPPEARFKTKCLSLPREKGKKRKTVMVPNDRMDQWEVVTTEFMREKYGDDPKPKYRYATPAVGFVQFPHREVTLDPYLMGLLLGDGGLSRNSVRISSADSEILDAVRTLLPPHMHLVHNHKYDYSFSIIGGRAHGRRHENDVAAAIRAYGLLGTNSVTKFVPDDYLYNDPETRLAVLQGLMDTDGSISTDGAAEYTSVSPALRDAVIFLARSFGGKAAYTTRRNGYTHKGERRIGAESYRVRIRLPHVPLFRLPRKLERVIRPVSTSDHNIIHTFREVEPAEAFCISVEHPTHTYVTNDFIVTHNTWSSAYEIAMHLTGQYPDWWKGKRWSRATVGWALGITNETVRDTLQRLVLGRSGEWGTGTIPADCVLDVKRAQGIADAVDSVLVRHISGGISRLVFKSYERGREKLQGETIDFAALDEEAPLDIYMEVLTRTNATKGIVWCTFTPLLGMSEMVRRFLNESSPDREIIKMTIHDVEHYSEEERARIVASYPEHEREARALGIPMVGEGRVFEVAEAQIRVTLDELPYIPDHWPRICGIDFGWNHPFAAAWLAWDRDTDTIYVYDAYRVKKGTPTVHAPPILQRGTWVPVAWPKDGLQTEKGSGIALSEQYRSQGLPMLHEPAGFEETHTNATGQQTYRYSVEAGVLEMLDRMKNGKFKVYAHLTEFWEEFRMYHRKDGKIVPMFDDLISAVRYAYVSRRFAIVPPIHQRAPRHNRPYDWIAG